MSGQPIMDEAYFTPEESKELDAFRQRIVGLKIVPNIAVPRDEVWAVVDGKVVGRIVPAPAREEKQDGAR